MDPDEAFQKPPEPGTSIDTSTQSPFVTQQIKLRMMIERYRNIGHQFANVDPLGFSRQNFVGAIDSKVLNFDSFDFNEAEMIQKYKLKSGRAADA